MTTQRSEAERLLAGAQGAVGSLAARPLRLAPDNLVPRPWGGTKLKKFKRLGSAQGSEQEPIGESFEIAADPADEEARRYPSAVMLGDGSRVSLPRLLETHGQVILGEIFLSRYGRRFPLLPKLLNIRELLSVQGHPPGNTEVYVIVAAAPGATLRLGFNRDMDGPTMLQRLEEGRAAQARLLAALPADTDPWTVQKLLAPAFAGRALNAPDLARLLLAETAAPKQNASVARILSTLNDTYWWMLDAMNVIPVTAGQVIHNCNPARLLGPGDEPSAEVHALGNPEGLEVLALEIRKPGPTFRAWDNVRFPVRPVDIAAAVAALNLRSTAPAEFVVPTEPIQGRPGACVSVDSPYFRIEHLRPRANQQVSVDQQGVHCLHGLGGAATLVSGDGTELGRIAAGESLLAPISMPAYTLCSSSEAAAEIVKVTLPE